MIQWGVGVERRCLDSHVEAMAHANKYIMKFIKKAMY